MHALVRAAPVVPVYEGQQSPKAGIYLFNNLIRRYDCHRSESYVLSFYQSTMITNIPPSTLKINADNVDYIVSEAWQSVIEKVGGGHPLSSEKSLCFLFAMCIFEKVGPTLVLDFENQCYDELEGESKYLDLLFYTDASFKVAVEFKLPKKSKLGASNQPQTRKMVYRDIARLLYLRGNLQEIKACFFLMGINEHAYLNKGNYRRGVEFQVHHNHKISPDSNIVVSGLTLRFVEFQFIWLNVEERYVGKYFCRGAYCWLKPIKVDIKSV